MRTAGVPVGRVDDIKLNPDNTVDVAFAVDKRYQLYTSTCAPVRYETWSATATSKSPAGPGELRKMPAGSARSGIDNTQPALDLDALLGGLRPGVEGLDG